MNSQYIHALIDKFLDGRTTLQEERRLYAYFSQPEVDAELEPYRLLFSDLGEARLVKPATHRRARWQWIAGIAASIVLLFGAGWAWQSHQNARFEAQYAGSYAIVNGERETDVSDLRPEINSVMADADAIEAQLKKEGIE